MCACLAWCESQLALLFCVKKKKIIFFTTFFIIESLSLSLYNIIYYCNRSTINLDGFYARTFFSFFSLNNFFFLLSFFFFQQRLEAKGTLCTQRPLSLPMLSPVELRCARVDFYFITVSPRQELVYHRSVLIYVFWVSIARSITTRTKFFFSTNFFSNRFISCRLLLLDPRVRDYCCWLRV